MRARSVGLAACALIALAGCETAEGFGRDVETAGVAIQRGVEAQRPPAPQTIIEPSLYTPPPASTR